METNELWLQSIASVAGIKITIVMNLRFIGDNFYNYESIATQFGTQQLYHNGRLKAKKWVFFIDRVKKSLIVFFVLTDLWNAPAFMV